MPGTYITPKTFNRRWWIDISENDSPQWAEVSVGITSRGNSINEQSQEYYDMAGRGVAESEITGVSVSRTSLHRFPQFWRRCAGRHHGPPVRPRQPESQVH